MDIWIARCNKATTCKYCKEPINTGEPAVFGKMWSKSTESGAETRRFVVHMRWHAKRESDDKCCFVLDGLEYLRTHPHAETRGRKKMILPKDAKSKRLQILRQRARYVQMMKELLEAPLDGRDIDKVISIGAKIEKMKEQIELVGGIPASWS